MKTYQVQFLPDDKTVKAAAGKSLLEAATAAGIPVNCVCGGDGVCGKCRVIVKSGKVTADRTMFLTRREIQRGEALACQTYIDGDVVVDVPPESRVGGVPRLTSEDAIRYSPASRLVGEGADFPHNPLSQKVHLKIPEPDITDSMPDQERVYRVLRQDRELPVMQMGLSVLQRLPTILRKSHWNISALLGCRGGTVEVVEISPGNGKKGSHRNFGIAVDLGTTTVVAHLVDLDSSETVSTKAKYNSQASYGEDVISRIMYANSAERQTGMRDCVVTDINDLIAGLVLGTDVRLSEISFVLCAGNTTMTHMLFGLDPSNIRRDPYVPCASVPPTIRAAEVGIRIEARGLLTALPCISSYVGGDVVADVLVTGMTNSEDLSLLIDLGTNGELVIGNSEWLVCCSASAGPSFEGGGITCGMRATNGAVEHITLGPGGHVVDCRVVGDGAPLGFCGSGLIDILAGLVRVGCIDRKGRFQPDKCDGQLQIGESGERELLLFPGKETALGRDLVITEADIENLIRSKGSIYMAAECLLDHVDLTMQDLDHVYIAGGFGNYLNIDKAIAIGLLPDLNRDKYEFIGNGSVQGAKMALLSQEALLYIQERVAGVMIDFELSTNHRYMNEYSSCLFLPHTNIEKFPSLMAERALAR